MKIEFRKIPIKNITNGDLVLMSLRRPEPWLFRTVMRLKGQNTFHAAVYVGNGNIAHLTSSGFSIRELSIFTGLCRVVDVYRPNYDFYDIDAAVSVMSLCVFNRRKMFAQVSDMFLRLNTHRLFSGNTCNTAVSEFYGYFGFDKRIVVSNIIKLLKYNR